MMMKQEFSMADLCILLLLYSVHQNHQLSLYALGLARDGWMDV
jgi:hypothetical protein